MCKGKQQMKFWKLVSAVIALVLSTSVNAALIDNGGYTTDTETGLDWLDLSATFGYSYNSALSASSGYEGGGWSYANNEQVDMLFTQLFPNFIDNVGNGSADSQYGPYSGQLAEITNFTNLFGTHNDGVHHITYGLYNGDSSILQMMGAWKFINNGRGVVYGSDWTHDYTAAGFTTGSSPFYGTYLVRTNPDYVSAVPVPAAVWLFGSGLIGLVGFARRKKA